MSSVVIMEQRKKIHPHKFTLWVAIASILMMLQVLGFTSLAKAGLTLQKNVSVSFLYVIIGLHAVHVIGGVVALMVMFVKAFRSTVKNYSTVPIEVMATYWHFVDVLWIYLLVFLLAVR
jgi:cytochrome c oxidase subunit 3